MTELALLLLTLSAILFSLGLGLYFMVVPANLRSPGLFPFLSILLGTSLLVLVGTYLISAGYPISYEFPIAAIIALVTAAERVFRMAREILGTFRRSWILAKTSWPMLTGLFAGVIIVASPALRGTLITTPARIGIDQVGYAETAQFLMSGGTLTMAEESLKSETGKPDLDAAKLVSDSSMRINTYIDADFLLGGLRWGYSALLAAMTQLMGYSHVFHLAFALLAIFYGCLLAIVYFACRSLFGASPIAASALAAGVGLNCNLLNTYYEGQYAQIFVAPFLLLIFLQFLWLRCPPAQSQGPDARGGWGSLALLALLGATIMCSYNEALLSLLVACFGALICDVAIDRRLRRNWILILALTALLSGLIVFPFALRWVSYIPKHLKNVHNGGWWQAHWASPAEILGCIDIYAKTIFRLLSRSGANEFSSQLLSTLFVGVCFAFLVRSRRFDRWFWLSFPGFVMLIFLKTRFWDRDINYQYMKAYTIFLPMLFLLCFAAVEYCRHAVSPRLKNGFTAGSILLLALICVNGLDYISRYRQESVYVTDDMFSLQQAARGKLLSQYALLSFTEGFQGDYNEAFRQEMTSFMISPLFPMNWANENPRINVSPHLDQELAVLIFKNNLECPNCFPSDEERKSSIVLETGSFFVLALGHTVREISGAAPTFDYRHVLVQLRKRMGLKL